MFLLRLVNANPETPTHAVSSESRASSSKDACDNFRKRMLGDKILTVDQLFRGMTYGDLLREWLLWLHSDSPTYRGYPKEIRYLHGNLSYFYDRDTGIRKQAEKFQNRAKGSDKIFRGDIIFDDTPIFVPATSAFYSVGETYYHDSKKLETIADCQFICRRDIMEGGPNWLRIQKKGCEEIDLSGSLSYVESPSFRMTVSEKSPLRDYFEMPIVPDTYDTVTVAKAALITSLPEGEYRLHYGGYGRGTYFSDTVHDFIVKPATEGSHASLIHPIVEIPKYDKDLEPL
jgi:hypothetical protein